MIEELRAWARKYNDDGRYNPVGVAFHWGMAALILLQIAWGWYMSFVPSGGDKLQGFLVHSAIGLPILLLGLVRFAWHLFLPGPYNDADTQGWQTQVAYATHHIFYVCFVGLPLSGWAMWSALPEPGPLTFAGLFSWPLLPFHDLPLTTRWAIMDIAEDVHHVLIWTLMVLIPLHVGAALKHHFWDRHDVLRGMLPVIPDEETPRAKRPRKRRPPQSPTASGAG